MRTFVMSLALAVGIVGCGEDGKDGKDGTSARIISQINCYGSVVNGAWAGMTIRWSASKMSSGDVFASGFLEDLGAFNVSGSVMYSHTQVGASTGTIIVSIDDYHYAVIEYNPATDGIIIEIKGPNPAYLIDSSPDTCNTLHF